MRKGSFHKVRSPRFGRVSSEDCNSRVLDNKEHLSGGFFKIKSKNLDVLVKKDYYGNRFQNGASNEISSLSTSGIRQTIPAVALDTVFNSQMVSHLSHNFLGFSNSEKNDFLCENPKDSNVNKVIRQSYVKAEFPDENNRTKDGPLTAIKDCKSKVQTGHLEHQDVDVTAPRKHVINKHASPFYPRGYINPASTFSEENPALCLYAPGTQTVLPCDEIVFLNPDASTMFPPSSNVYFQLDGMVIDQAQFMGPHLSMNEIDSYDQFGVPYSMYSEQLSNRGSLTSPSDLISTDAGTDSSSADSSLNSPAEVWGEIPLYVNDYSQVEWIPLQYFHQEPRIPDVQYEHRRQKFNCQHKNPTQKNFKVATNYESKSQEGSSNKGTQSKEEMANNSKLFEDGTKKESLPRAIIPGLQEDLKIIPKMTNKKRRKKKKLSQPFSQEEVSAGKLQESAEISTLSEYNFQQEKADVVKSGNDNEKEIPSQIKIEKIEWVKIPELSDKVGPCKSRRSRGKRSGQKQREKLLKNSTLKSSSSEKFSDDEMGYESNEKQCSHRLEDDVWVTLVKGKKIPDDKIMFHDGPELETQMSVEEFEEQLEKTIDSVQQQFSQTTLDRHQSESTLENNIGVENDPLTETASELEKLETTFPEAFDDVSTTFSGAVINFTHFNQGKLSMRQFSKDKRKDEVIKQVLVHDGLLNFSEFAINGDKKVLKDPRDVRDKKAFILKDIGHGMQIGPMLAGRISLGNCFSQDRCAKILTEMMKQHQKHLLS